MPQRHAPPLLDAEERHKETTGVRPSLHDPTAADASPPLIGPLETGTPPEPLSTPALTHPPVKLHKEDPASSSPQSPPDGDGAPSSEPPVKEGITRSGGIDFHHASEAEFARLLNYYGIEWEYEPRQFPVQWRDGRVIEMFSPDFYLTEYDLFIELTTMRQSLVRRKNRKLRLIRALYPEISIKLLYRRDYQRLLERFGIPPGEMEAEMAP